jgi:hypothetical protein
LFPIFNRKHLDDFCPDVAKKKFGGAIKGSFEVEAVEERYKRVLSFFGQPRRV